MSVVSATEWSAARWVARPFRTSGLASIPTNWIFEFFWRHCLQFFIIYNISL